MTTISRPANARRGKGRPGSTMPWLLRQVNQRYRDAIAARLAEAGFGDLPQRGYWALAALVGEADDASQLVSEMGVTKQTVSKLVDMLVASEFIDRQTNPTDRRRTTLTLAAKGRKAVAVIEQAVQATEREFTAQLGAASLEKLTRMLGQIARRA
jgi:DNA-binding MarR family transcriptional regulator